MRLMFVLSIACFAPCAQAQAQAGAAPPSRCEAPVYHQFDFWVGEWTVTNPAGQKVGESSITREEAGCLIVEHWKSGKGNAGQSYNFYDAAAKKWRQVWIAPSELTDYSGGLNANREMVLEGVSQEPAGATQKSRGTWTANKDGTVRQRFSEWDPKKKAWVESFNGLYARKS